MNKLGLTICISLLAGCYSPNVPSGQQLCSNDGKCPEGYQCFPDHHCYVAGAMPDCSPACTTMGKPVCDKTTLQCVECLADTDCPPGGLCVPGMNICKMGCSATHPGCASDAGSCDVDLGVCRGCLSDAECTDTANPRCDAPSGRCVPCVPANDNCPSGKYCSGANGNFSCLTGCKIKDDCGAGSDGGVPVTMDCCNHQCVDTSVDKGNCGSCGKACADANTCCSGTCSDVTTDISNCGGCGMACMLANVMGPSCTASICGFAKCNPGFGDCDLKPQNGCETNIGMDPKNCGGCGNACGPFPNAIAGCVTASCSIAACMKGFADCDNSVKTGCEIDIFNDIENCGGCGNICPNVVNGTPGCTLGKCGVGTCTGNFRDCDGIAQNGCEANLFMDPKNCGGCGMPCSYANAMGVCTNAVCGLGACNTGFANCDMMAANGCEVNLNTDVNNCGACANKCAQGLTCSAGKCTLVCAPGKANCDGNQANGCNVNLTNDPLNCGACGNKCNANVTCVNSVCTGCQTGFADCDGIAANGCEVNLNTDAANCGKCKTVCPMGMACAAGVCTNGCLAGGKLPPVPCTVGADPQTQAGYVICTADCNTAWIANSSNVGGKYHALEICQLYGYGSVTMQGGTCGSVCGYCDGATCMKPGLQKFDAGGGCGSDANGPILCTTVHWLCSK